MADPIVCTHVLESVFLNTTSNTFSTTCLLSYCEISQIQKDKTTCSISRMPADTKIYRCPNPFCKMAWLGFNNHWHMKDPELRTGLAGEFLRGLCWLLLPLESMRAGTGGRKVQTVLQHHQPTFGWVFVRVRLA